MAFARGVQGLQTVGHDSLHIPQLATLRSWAIETNSIFASICTIGVPHQLPY